jgi:uncharacterized protein YdaU (DUF1376 family)
MVWVGDFLSDPHVAAMDPAEVGAFWLLLLYAAQQGGSLPNDDALLARLSRLGDKWQDHRARVLAAWVVTPSSITQKRLKQEVQAAAGRRAAARASGKLGAKSRWAKEKDGDPNGDAMAMPWLNGSGLEPTAKEEPKDAAAPRSSAPDPEANQRSVLGLLGGMAERMAMPAAAPKNEPTKLAWDWLSGNANRGEATRAMAFVGWLMKTGTRDPEMLLALVKDYVVHHPDNPHAYYTPKGMARQNIVTRVAADRAVAEHERIKREERAFLGRQ